MKTLYISLFTFAIAIAMLAFIRPAAAQVVDCSVNPERCVTEDVFYPTSYGNTLFLEPMSTIHFYGIVGEAPNQRIQVTYQPAFTMTDNYRYLWVLSARATPPDFVGWTRENRGCFQFWGYGLAKRERVCLYEWAMVGGD